MTEARPRIRHHKGDSKCGRCGPGWGVMKSCGPNHETECGRCEHGSYSPHHSLQPCWICSRCGPGLYEAHPCTTKTDTVCDSCHRQAPDNEDYQRKCQNYKRIFLAPEDAKSTGEESSIVNDENDSIDEEEREAILEEDIRDEFIEAQEFNDNASSLMQRF